MLVAVCLLVGCGDDDDDMMTPDAPPAGRSVAATAPGGTNVDCGSTVTLNITTTDFVLEAPTGQPNQDGHGHYHVYLDNATGGDYLAADAAATVDVALPAGVTAGAHTLRVELFENDHSAITPAITSTVELTVSDAACVRIASATPATVAAGGDTDLVIETGNFTFEAPMGQPNAQGVGHYHVYLDDAVAGDYLAADAVSPVTVTIPAGTAPGPHTLRVELMENDHTELDIEDTIDIVVQ
jgi:hypothetical protein